MSKVFRRDIGLAVLLVGVGAGAAFAQQKPSAKPTAEPAAAQPQQPWGSRCVAVGRETALDCLIEQRLIVANTRQLLGAVTIRIPGETKKPVLMIQTPLGLFLPAGVVVDVDGANKKTFELQTCNANGCYIGSPMPKELLNHMQKGEKLNIVFQNLQKQPITISMALTGFAEAYQKIR